MRAPSESTRGLARRLVAACRTSSDPSVDEPGLAIERLRISLTRLAGVDGFATLLRRALTLAGRELPSLRGLEVEGDGRLMGLERYDAAGAGCEAAVVITAQLLELLVTFIGEPITLRLVREGWPDVSLDEYTTTSEAD